MLKLSKTQYIAVGSILLALVTAVSESGLVPPQYMGVLTTIGTLLGLLLGRKPDGSVSAVVVATVATPERESFEAVDHDDGAMP